jgi:hypothetical protein
LAKSRQQFTRLTIAQPLNVLLVDLKDWVQICCFLDFPALGEHLLPKQEYGSPSRYRLCDFLCCHHAGKGVMRLGRDITPMFTWQVGHQPLPNMRKLLSKA